MNSRRNSDIARTYAHAAYRRAAHLTDAEVLDPLDRFELDELMRARHYVPPAEPDPTIRNLTHASAVLIFAVLVAAALVHLSQAMS